MIRLPNWMQIPAEGVGVQAGDGRVRGVRLRRSRSGIACLGILRGDAPMAEQGMPEDDARCLFTSFGVASASDVEVSSPESAIPAVRGEGKSSLPDTAMPSEPSGVPTDLDGAPGESVENSVADGIPLGEGAEAVRRMVASFAPRAERLVLGLDARFSLLRSVAFPFSSRSKIAGVLSLEMENLLPFGCGDLALSFTLGLSQGRAGRTVLAAAVRREVVEEYGQALCGTDIGLPLLDLEWSGMDALAGYLGLGETQTVLLLDWGRERLALVERRFGFIVAARTVPVGTDALEAAWDADQPGRDFWSSEVDVLEAECPECACLLRLALSELLLPYQGAGSLVDESGEGGALSEVGVQHDQVEIVVISGAGARLQGMVHRVEEIMGVRTISLLEAWEPTVIDREMEPVDRLEFAVAWGLALRALGLGRGFDLLPAGCRRASRRLSSGLRRVLRLGVATAFVLALLAWAVFSVRLHLAEKALAESARQAFARAVPDYRGEFAAGQALAILRTRLQESKNYAALGGARPIESLAAEKVRAVGLAALKAKTIINGFDMTDGTLTLDGEAEDFAAAEEMRTLLEKKRIFDGVELKDARKEKGHLRFTLVLGGGV